MIDLKPHPEGALLPVRAQAGARRNELRGSQGGALKVSVTQAPEKGKANHAIVELLCQRLALRRGQVELLAGATAPRKTFLVRGLSAEQLRDRIEAALRANPCDAKDERKGGA
mgnify:CR=1 FL=1